MSMRETRRKVKSDVAKCAIGLHDLSFFAENTITANIYLGMLQFGGTEGEEKGEVLFEEGGAPSDFSQEYEMFRMSDFLIERLE